MCKYLCEWDFYINNVKYDRFILDAHLVGVTKVLSIISLNGRLLWTIDTKRTLTGHKLKIKYVCL